MSSERPEGWSVTPLGEIAELIMGQSPPSSTVTESGDGLPFIQGNAEFGARHPSPRFVASTTPKVVQTGDILISVRAPVGEVNIAEGPLCIGRGVGGIRATDCESSFLFYAVGGLSQTFARLSQGSTFDAINGKELRSIEILLPPLDEQRRIAEVLRSVDEAIGSTEQALRQSGDVKAGLLQELFAKGLGHSDFRETRIGLLPSQWDVRPLGSCFENLDSQRRPVKKEDRARMRGEIPYYGASGIIDWVSDYLFDEPLLLLAEDGANLISKSTPIAFISTGRSWINNHAHVYRPTTALDIVLAQEWLSFADISPFITGSAQPKLNKDRADAILMPIPPVEEQARMKEVFHAANHAIAEEADKLRVLQELKLNLSNDLLSGRVRVPA